MSLRYRAPSGSPLSAQYQEMLAGERAAELAAPAEGIVPADHSDRTLNPLRPRTFGEIVGQAPAKELLKAALAYARRRGEPMAHMLLVGPAGTGKSTLAHVVASELGVHVYQLAAPVSFDTLLELRTTMHDGDVLFIDEIHLQAIGERRGKEAITAPEVLYGVLEDRVIPTSTGVLPFPHITMIGGTTDEGMLSDAFLSRFPLRPRLLEYTVDELAEIARRNARALGATLSDQAARLFGIASRGTPREVNNLIRNAIVFGHNISGRRAREVLARNGIEERDGLTPDMAELLKFIYRTGRQESRDGEVRYRSSVSSIATGIGKSRDTKAVVLRIEPYLIRRGYLAILPGGRQLTEGGTARARELVAGGPRGRRDGLQDATPATLALASMGVA